MDKNNDVIYNTTDGETKPVSFLKRPRSKARNSVYVAGGFALAAVGMSTVVAPAAELVAKLEQEIIPEMAAKNEILGEGQSDQGNSFIQPQNRPGLFGQPSKPGQSFLNIPALSPNQPATAPGEYKVPAQVLPALPTLPSFDNVTSATPVGGGGNGGHGDDDDDDDDDHDDDHEDGHDDHEDHDGDHDD